MVKEKSPHVWLLNVSPDQEVRKEFMESATWDYSPVYKPYDTNAGRLMLEYDAAVWKSPDPIASDSERTRQLFSFLKDDSKIFVFLISRYITTNSASLSYSNLAIVRDLLAFQNSDYYKFIHYNKNGYQYSLTSDGQMSGFREFLESEPQQWFVSVQKQPGLVPLAVNAEGEAVAFSLANVGNHAFFLPSPTSASQMRIFIRNLLEVITGSANLTTPAPTWTGKFALTGMDELKGKIDEIKEEIIGLEKQVTTHQSKLNRHSLTRNTLLSGDGKDLEDAVKSVLEAIGYNPVPGPIGQQDLTFQHGGKDFLAEVKGTTTSAGEGHIKQLKAKQTRFEEETKSSVKGVLIINPWRHLEPAKRETEGRAIYPDAMMPLVNIWNFCLMTSVQVFAIYQLHLNGKLDPNKLSDAIHSTVGPLKGYELKA